MVKSNLDSVWYGNDSDLLDIMIPFYCHEYGFIVDATCGKRIMWKGILEKYSPIGWDIRPEVNPQINDSWENLRIHYKKSVDLIVFDPPHWPTSSKGRINYNDSYGLKDFGGSDSIIKTFPKFFDCAKESLKNNGTVFAKICDLVNGRKSRWQAMEMALAAQNCGFTFCDQIIKVRKNTLISSKWKKQHHARKKHSYWMIFRNGKSCQ